MRSIQPTERTVYDLLNKRKEFLRTDAADARAPFLICTILGAALLGVTLIVASLAPQSLIAFVTIMLLVDMAVAIPTLISYFIRIRHAAEAEREAELRCAEVGNLFRDTVGIGYAIVDRDGVVKVVNRWLQNILGYRTPLCRVLLTDLCGMTVGQIASSAAAYAAGEEVDPLYTRIGGCRVGVRAYPMRASGGDCFLAVFSDCTAYLDLRDRTEAERPAVAYAILDSLEELAQYVRVSYRDAAHEIELILKDWVKELGGLIREYDRDKYLIILPHASIERCISEKFSILERVRAVQLGDNSFPVTISIGICDRKLSFYEQEHEARTALDLALQRGGDQVALKTEDGSQFFGGRVKTLQGSSTAIQARVAAIRLADIVSRADNVLIMGHRNPDFDSIGSTVGAVRFAISARGGSTSGVYAVIDPESSEFRECAKRLSGLPYYKEMFVSRTEGLDLIRSNTLLIATDVNNFKIIEAPDIAAGAAQIAIIDHHRQAEEFSFTPALSYILPTASSASELVTEMLEQSPYAETLCKEEAELLLAGMMLDTKNFTHSTGAQTFAAVHYLYERGAHTDVSRKLFNESIDDYRVASDFGARTQIYREKIAITWLPGDRESNAEDRVAASKAADKLLNVRGIEASFALVNIGGAIVISARSADRINVQLILEKLGGGGHYDMAGAQLKDTPMFAACSRLRDAIDDYLDHEYREKR